MAAPSPSAISWAMTRLALAAALASFLCAPGNAHDVWENGQPVPAWVKEACCGPADYHHIPVERVHVTADGYRIDGISTPIPFRRAQPSPDGEYYGFWNEAGEPDPLIYCFFAPPGGV